jgi:DNA primase catalytic subunit
MAHTYMLFDFGADEEKAQQARHKLEGWKQAFRLDKKLLYKIDRISEDAADEAEAKPANAEKGKGKSKAATKTETAPAKAKEEIKLLVRLDFSSHEKLSGQRWIERIPAEEPFTSATPKTLKSGDPEFEATAKQFDELA